MASSYSYGNDGNALFINYKATFIDLAEILTLKHSLEIVKVFMLKAADIRRSHVLRASTVTYLKQQGFSDSDIMRVTGHASAEMVYAYDKTSRADNASKKVSLVI